MAEFKEELVINALHTDKAVIGKKYWYSDSLFNLKKYVENNFMKFNGKLTRFEVNNNCPFYLDTSDACSAWQYLYPYEEPPKQRMTNIQLMEWLSKGNGIFKHKGNESCFNYRTCLEVGLNEEVNEDIVICTWDSSDWIVPSIDIYERDCKHTDNIL